ncbi:MAG: hypothetical protein ACOYCB_12220 [Fastidiosipilaceae bacterium]
MREFARTRYENVVYVRFDKDKLLWRIFDKVFCGRPSGHPDHRGRLAVGP